MINVSMEADGSSPHKHQTDHAHSSHSFLSALRSSRFSARLRPACKRIRKDLVTRSTPALRRRQKVLRSLAVELPREIYCILEQFQPAHTSYGSPGSACFDMDCARSARSAPKRRKTRYELEGLCKCPVQQAAYRWLLRSALRPRPIRKSTFFCRLPTIHLVGLFAKAHSVSRRGQMPRFGPVTSDGIYKNCVEGHLSSAMLNQPDLPV